MKWIPAIALGAGVAMLAAMGWAAIEDANGDGMISFEEALVTYPTLTAETFQTLDTDGDGMLTMDEVAAAEEAGTLMADG